MPKIINVNSEMKESTGKTKKIIAGALAGIMTITGASFAIKNGLKPVNTTASDGTSNSDTLEDIYDAEYFSNHNLDVNALVSNESALSVGDMINQIKNTTGVELPETLFDLYNMRYLNEDLNELDIPENKIWSTLIKYRKDLYEVASYGMMKYYNLSTALRDNDSKKIDEWSGKLKKELPTPFNIITRESFASKKFKDRYVSIVDKQANFLKNHTLFDVANEAEVELNAKAFYELAQEIKKTPIIEADYAKMLKEKDIDLSKVDAITVSEGIALSEFVTANYMMFKDVYLKLDKKQSDVKYVKFFENEFQNYFDNYDEIMRKYYNLSEKECEEVTKRTKEYEKIVYKEKNNKKPSPSSSKKRTVKKTIKKSKKIGEVTTKTKVKPGIQVVDDKTGEKALVKVDEKGNGSADVHKEGGEPVSHKEEVIKPAEKITEEDKAPEQPKIPATDILSEEEYEKLINGNVRFSDSLLNNGISYSLGARK